MKGHRFYKAVAAALAIGSIVAACSSNSGVMPLSSNGSATQGGAHQNAGKPVRGKLANLGTTQATVTAGTMIETLNATVNGGIVTLTDGSTCGGSPDPCAISNHANWPQLSVPAASNLTVDTLVSSASCPGQCYVVAYEGGVGPYIIDGPATSGSTGTGLTFAASALLAFQPLTTYNFFIESVTGMTATPAPVPPTAIPTPTTYPTAPPTSTAAPTPKVVPTPTPVACGRFSVLSTNPFYANVHFDRTSVENGDIGMNGAAQAGFHTERDATINGTVFTAPGELVQTNDATITGGITSNPAVVAAAVANAETLSAGYAAMSATQPISSINMGNKSSQTINGTSGVNVINLDSLEMGHATTLTLNAPAGSKFVINVAGEMRIGNTAQILVSGGITSNDVTFNFPGSNGQVWVQFTSVVNGTILAPYRTNLHIDHTTTVNGAVIGDGAVMEFAWGDTVGTNCGS